MLAGWAIAGLAFCWFDNGIKDLQEDLQTYNQHTMLEGLR
jgi:hypothetical protein